MKKIGVIAVLGAILFNATTTCMEYRRKRKKEKSRYVNISPTQESTNIFSEIQKQEEPTTYQRKEPLMDQPISLPKKCCGFEYNEKCKRTLLAGSLCCVSCCVLLVPLIIIGVTYIHGK